VDIERSVRGTHPATRSTTASDSAAGPGERCTVGASSSECPRHPSAAAPLARSGAALRNRPPSLILIKNGSGVPATRYTPGECGRHQRGWLTPRARWGAEDRARDVGTAKTVSERQFSACRNSTDRGPIGPQRYTETPCRPPVDVVHEELLVRREALRVETRRILLKPECFIDTASEHRQSSSRVHQVCREPQPAIS
jgi:hypothetical protein